MYTYIDDPSGITAAPSNVGLSICGNQGHVFRLVLKAIVGHILGDCMSMLRLTGIYQNKNGYFFAIKPDLSYLGWVWTSLHG